MFIFMSFFFVCYDDVLYAKVKFVLVLDIETFSTKQGGCKKKSSKEKGLCVLYM